jgi:hypothetical protein
LVFPLLALRQYVLSIKCIEGVAWRPHQGDRSEQ